MSARTSSDTGALTMNRTITAIAGVVAVAAGAFGGLGTTNSAAVQTTAHARSTAVQAVGTKAAHTRITLHVDTCRHCPVRLVQASVGKVAVWHSTTKHVEHGTVSFRVLTRHTHGMSFEIRPRWSLAGYVPNIVTRYAGTDVGDVVTNDVARHKQRAAGCWEGTSSSHVSLDVRAVKFPLRDMMGNPGHSVRAWFKPTLASTPPMVGTTKGAIGNQDTFYCTR
jgi:hypothetical protein